MSRQRHDSKRNNSRSTSSAPRQRRQTQTARKTPQSATNGTAGAWTKRATSGSPQLVIAEATTTAKTPKTAKATTSKATTSKATTSKATTSKATTRKTTAPGTTTPKAAPKARAAAASKAAKEATRTGQTDQREQREQLAPALAPVDTLIVEEAPVVTQTPEVTAVSDAFEPEIPETPETADISEIPAVPAVPAVPETPETPAEPTEPEAQAEPTEPAKPDEPDEPDEPAEQAPETPAPVARPRPERRMPTLAVMTHARHDAENKIDQPAADDPGPTAEQANGATVAEGAADVAESSQASTPAHSILRRKRRGKTAEPITPSAAAAAAAATVAQAAHEHTRTGHTEAAQQTSIITRPVSARYSNRRRKIPRTPDLIWENDPHLPDFPWPLSRQRGNRPQPLPPADLLIPVVIFHVSVVAVLGLLAALFGLNSGSATSAAGSWALMGALIAGLGGAVAYVLGESATSKRFAPHALLASQLGLLAWAMIALGPRPSLLALAPALVEVMLLLGGTTLASMLAIGALAIYAVFAGLSVSIGLGPVIMLAPTSAVVLDVVCIVVGLLAALWLLLAIQAGRERALAIARARRHEADVLRNLVTQFRQEAQDDTGKLESALLQALKGHGVSAIPTEGMYRLLAETIMDTASRLEVLQRDREERLRLEGALRVIIRAVERQWLGIEPEWPGHTGTAIDELVALLRTPRLDLTYQQESQSPSITPRLIPIPTVAVERDTPTPTPISRPLSGASWLAPRRRARRPDLYPVPSADNETPHPDEEDGHTGSGSFWSVRDYQPTPDEP